MLGALVGNEAPWSAALSRTALCSRNGREMGWSWGYALASATTFFVVAAALQTSPHRQSKPSLLNEAAVRAAATSPPLPATLAFPLSAGGNTSAGRFHTLPSLQCQLHGSSGGGNGSGNHGTAGGSDPGWVLVANESARPVVIPYAPGTCATPLSDAFQLLYLAAPVHVDATFSPSGASTNVDVGGNITGEYEWAGNTFLSWGAHTARNRVPVGGEVTADWYSPQPCATRSGGPPPGGLLCEEQLVRLLGQHRGSRGGRVDRWVGIFDVALITRGTLGWALDPNAYVVASGDAVSFAAGGATPALVTYTDASGVRRPVLIGEAGLLSLGRAALADPSWLGPSVPGGIAAIVELQTTEDSIVQRKVQWMMKVGLANDPRNQSAHSTPWLQEVAYALCVPPVGSFIGDAGLCAGVPPRKPTPSVTLSADGEQVVERLDMAARPFRGQTGVAVSWTVNPPARLVVPAPLCEFPPKLMWNDVRRQPIWLLGRGDREVPRAGWSTNPAEADLARRLESCRYTAFREDLASGTKWPVSLTDRAAELAQEYRRDLFLVDPPEAPATDIDIVLAALVVVPEAVALLLHLLQPAHPPSTGARRGRVRRGLSVGFIISAGVLSLLAIGFLDAQEQSGASWRAAALRLETRIAANETEQASMSGQQIDYTGRPVWYVESLFLVARPGYRPAVTRRLLIVLSFLYGILSVVVVVNGLRRWWRADVGAAEDPEAAAAEGIEIGRAHV